MQPSFLFPVTHIRLFLVFLCLRLPALDRSEHAVFVARNQAVCESTKILSWSSAVDFHAGVMKINKLFIVRDLRSKNLIF